VARHCGTRPADDDRTVMILRFDNFTPARPALIASATVPDETPSELTPAS